MNANGPVQEPDLRALLNAHRDEIFASLNSVRVGTIASFDLVTQTATVRINAQAVVFNQAQPTDEGLQQTPSFIDYPVLTDVPVFFPTGGGASLRLPVTAGDTCAVLFNDRDLDAWFATGAIAAPNSPRMHSLSDGLAIVGFRSLANKLDDYSGDQAELKFAGSSVILKADGTITLIDGAGSKLRISPDGTVLGLAASGANWHLNPDKSVAIAGGAGGSVTITAAGEVDLLAVGGAKVIVNADGTVQIQATGGAVMKLDALLDLHNGATSLLTALNLVVTALTALNAKTGPSAAAQIAAAQASILSLLE